jgi:hypothetical protein
MGRVGQHETLYLQEEKMETKDFSRTFVMLAIIMPAAIVLWATLQAISTHAGSMEEQMNWVARNTALFKMNYPAGSFLTIPSVLLLFLMMSQKRAEDKVRVLDILGVVCLVLYFVFIQLSYSSQYLLVPRLITAIPATDTSLMKWFFIGYPSSISALLKMMGYTFMSVGAVTIGFPFVKVRGYSLWISWFLFLSGVAGLIGWLESYFELPSNGLGMTLSGLLMIPFCVSILLTTGKTRIVLKSSDLCF